MKKNFFKEICVGSALALLLLSGCSSKVVQGKSDSLTEITKEDLNKNKILNGLSVQEKHISKKNIYLASKMKLSQALSNLGSVDKRTYILQDKDIEIGGYPNLKFSNFFELNKILLSIYNVEMKIEQNTLDATLPKIIKLYPRIKTTILDEIQINQKGLLVPSNLLSTISQYTNGWKINYTNDLKENLNKNDYSHFRGSLRDFLNYFSELNDYFLEYNYKTKTITLSKYKSKIFRLKGSKEKITYTNNVSMDLDGGSSSNSSSSGGTMTSGIETKETYDLMENTKQALTAIIPKQTKDEYFSMIPESGYIIASTTSSKMKKVEEIITSINTDSFKNIYIKVTLLQTKLDNTHQRGVNWGYIKEKMDSLGSTVGVVTGAISGNLADLSGTLSSDTVLTYRGTNGASAIVKALNEFGDTGIAYQASTITTNNVPAMINLANIQDYIYKTETDNTGDNPTVTASQNEVQGGRFLYVKPSAFDDEIKVSLTILDRTINPFEKHEFGNNQFLQSKNVDKKMMNYTVVLRGGEKVVIGGFMQKKLNKGYNGLSNNKDSSLSELVGFNNKEYVSEEMALMLEVVER